MPRGDKTSYTDKQKRMAGHIEEGYEKRGVSVKESERRAGATVNKVTGGGKRERFGPWQRVIARIFNLDFEGHRTSRHQQTCQTKQAASRAWTNVMECSNPPWIPLGARKDENDFAEPAGSIFEFPCKTQPSLRIAKTVGQLLGNSRKSAQPILWHDYSRTIHSL